MGLVIVGECKEHYNLMLNVEFRWDSDNMRPAEPVLGPWPPKKPITVDMVVCKMKIGKATEVSDLVVEMQKAAGDVGVIPDTDLIRYLMTG